MYWNPKVRRPMRIVPMTPCMNTILRGSSSCLSNTFFSTISPKLLNRIETKRSPKPISCSATVAFPAIPFDKTDTTWTVVIPMNAREHPTIARLVNVRFRMTRERMAVVTMTPPLEICHTELSTRLRAMYDSKVESKSMRAGKMAEVIGAGGLAATAGSLLVTIESFSYFSLYFFTAL